jgi:phenylacetate-CoA ligase
MKWLREYEESQYYSEDEIAELRWERLKSILEHAYTNTSFYKKRFDSAGITLKDIKSPEDLSKLPILARKDIQNNYEEMIARNFNKDRLIEDMTGGSTATPVKFYYDWDRLSSRWAAKLRHNKWANWEIGDKAALLWGSSRDMKEISGFRAKLRNYFLNRSISLDTSYFDEESMRDFTMKILRFKPKIFQAYASSMALFAKYVKKNNIKDIQPKGIITSAEVLQEQDRILIEETFECKVFNRYGCREVGTIATECSEHEGMHINAEGIFVEFINQNRQFKEEDLGQIIVTDLLNYAMPLIRYQIGDVGKPLYKNCKCGKGLPLIEKINGRILDFIITPKGKMVSLGGINAYVIAKISGIQQLQFIQDQRDKLKITVIKGPTFDQNSIETLKRKLFQFMDEEMGIDIEYTDQILPEASGKFRFCKSSIADDFFIK